MFIKILIKKKAFIYGKNYKTKDGSCVRDYIHIKDICLAIDKSLSYLSKNKKKFEIINIGSSSKLTNFEILSKVEKITKIKSNFEVIKNRKGDIDKLSCSINKANKKINWKPKYSNIENIIKDEIKWVKYLKVRKFKRKFKNYTEHLD